MKLPRISNPFHFGKSSTAKPNPASAPKTGSPTKPEAPAKNAASPTILPSSTGPKPVPGADAPTFENSPVNLSKRDRLSYNNALGLGRMSKASYSEFNHEVNDTQFLHKEYKDHQVVAFAGTQDTMDFVTDAKFLKTSLEGMGKVHVGFDGAYKEIAPELEKCLNKDKPVFLTGHSLGGATTIIAAQDLKKKGYDVAGVYTYGNPRVGDSKFKKAYDNLGIPTHRFVNSYDLVPRVPKIFYRHVERPVFMSGDGRLLQKQESATKLWLWQVLGQRLGSHKMASYLPNLEKLQQELSPNSSVENLPGLVASA